MAQKLKTFGHINRIMIVYSEVANRGVLLKKEFLKIWQYSQENTLF